MPKYLVVGTDQASGRARRWRIVDATTEGATKEATRRGMVVDVVELLPNEPPTEEMLCEAKELGCVIPADANYDVVERLIIDNTPATEAQIRFASELKISHPTRYSKAALSDAISEALVRRNPPSEGNLRTIRQMGIEPPRLMPKKELFDYVWNNLQNSGDDTKLAAWFTYRICRSFARGGPDHPSAASPIAPDVLAIAETLAADNKLMASMKRYSGRALIWFGTWTTPDGRQVQGGSKNTTAYKAAALLISERVGLVDPNIRQRGSGRRPRASKGSSASSGCLLPALTILAVCWLLR